MWAFGNKLLEDLTSSNGKFSPETGEAVTSLKQLGHEDVENRLRHFGII